MARHVHADLMIQAAENWDGLEWRVCRPDGTTTEWVLMVNKSPEWAANLSYQLRPIRKPRYQKRVEIPRAETEAPEMGVRFYTPDPNCAQAPYVCFNWNDGDYHRWILLSGLVYLNADDAAAHARAMLETEDGE